MTTRQNADYGYEIQKLYLEMMLGDAETFVRCQGIWDSTLFDRKLQTAAKFLKDYVDEHNIIPTPAIVNAATGNDFSVPDGLQEAHYDWLLTDFETFVRHKGLERAILESADLLEKGDYGPVEDKIKKAVQIGLQKDMGTDYFLDPRARLLKIKDKNGQISTGWKNLDQKLFGGFNRGELNIFAGGSGAGKSLFLANLGVNYALAGLNVIYLTLELSEELVSMRVDSMTTGISTKEIFKDLDGVEMKVKMIGKKAGAFQVKYMPSGPMSQKISAENLFIKDKYVSEELRNLAVEKNCVFVTAAQLNRGAVEEVEFDHSHISGGLSKIQTADNVFGIFTSRAMRERGKYQIQLMKTRSSSGVGMKIDLDFDIDTLRITDSEEQSDDHSGAQTAKSSQIMNSLKRSSSVDEFQKAQPREGFDPFNPAPNAGRDNPEIGSAIKRTPVQVESSKLRSLLNNLNTDV